MGTSAGRRALAFALTGSIVWLLTTGVASAASAPGGNNGTVKIDEYSADGGHGNDPHVGCRFSVSFFGYDTGTQHASMTFDPQAPTAGGKSETLTTSWTTARRSGGNQLDESYGPVDLSDAFAGVAPEPQQGWHVKLTVHVTGSHGSDVKHKTFWVSPCETATTAGPQVGAANTSRGTTTPAPAVAPSSAGGGAVVGAPAVGSGLPNAAVLGESITRAPATPATSATGTTGATSAAASNAAAKPTKVLGTSMTRSGGLAFTGLDAALLAALAAAAIAVGWTVVRIAERPTT